MKKTVRKQKSSDESDNIDERLRMNRRFTTKPPPQ